MGVTLESALKSKRGLSKKRFLKKATGDGAVNETELNDTPQQPKRSGIKLISIIAGMGALGFGVWYVAKNKARLFGGSKDQSSSHVILDTDAV